MHITADMFVGITKDTYIRDNQAEHESSQDSEKILFIWKLVLVFQCPRESR